MIRFISVDTGKYATKCVEYDPNNNTILKSSFKTKISDGDMRDDALESDTMLISFEGKTYKIGNGARGNGAALETTKMSEIHRICMLSAIAQFVSDNETDTVNCAIGLPAGEWTNVSKREDYKEFMFPKDEVVIQIRKDNSMVVHEKRFKFGKTFVFPESIGALYMNDSPSIDPNSYVGVIDLGNLNLNATLWQGGELLIDDSITDELGANILTRGLAAELSSQFSRVNEAMVTNILSKPSEYRYLSGNNDNIEEESKKVIKIYLLNHAKAIKRDCDSKKWPTSFMTIICIGGTSVVLSEELKEVFGNNITILNNSYFCNAMGFLRIMCAKLPEIHTIIEFNELKAS